MRRLAAAALVAVLAFVGTACDPELSRKLSGTFTGTASFQFSAQGCSFVHQEFEGTWIHREGAPGGTFHLTGCVTPVNESSFSYRGTFLMVTQGGAQLRGTLSGGTDGSCPADFD